MLGLDLTRHLGVLRGLKVVVVVFVVVVVGGMVLSSLGIVNLCAASATAAFYNVFKVNLLHAVFVVASGVLAERGS